MLTGEQLRQLFISRMGERGVLLMKALEPLLHELDTPVLPDTGETAAIAFHNPKTAALLFDRIWGGLNSSIPQEIRFRGGGTVEVGLLFMTSLFFAADKASTTEPAFAQMASELGKALLATLPDDVEVTVPAIDQYAHLIANGLAS